jgi:hypothetical protein
MVPGGRMGPLIGKNILQAGKTSSPEQAGHFQSNLVQSSLGRGNSKLFK